MSGLRTDTQWVIAGTLGLFALIALVGGRASSGELFQAGGAAVILLATAGFVIPPIRARLATSAGIRFSRWLVAILVLSGATVGIAMIPQGTDDSDSATEPVNVGGDAGIAIDAAGNETEVTERTNTTETETEAPIPTDTNCVP